MKQYILLFCSLLIIISGCTTSQVTEENPADFQENFGFGNPILAPLIIVRDYEHHTSPCHVVWEANRKELNAIYASLPSFADLVVMKTSMNDSVATPYFRGFNITIYNEQDTPIQSDITIYSQDGITSISNNGRHITCEQADTPISEHDTEVLLALSGKESCPRLEVMDFTTIRNDNKFTASYAILTSCTFEECIQSIEEQTTLLPEKYQQQLETHNQNLIVFHESFGGDNPKDLNHFLCFQYK